MSSQASKRTFNLLLPTTSSALTADYNIFYNEPKTEYYIDCKTTVEGLTIIFKEYFIENFDNNENANVIFLNIDNLLGEIENLKQFELRSKKWLLIIFQSTTCQEQIVIFWRNQDSNDEYKIVLEGQSKEFSNFLIEFLIKTFQNEKSVEFPPIINASDIALTFIRDSNGYNLLMKAIENDKFDLFDELMKLPFDLHEKARTIDDEEVTAADIVWKKKNKEILLKLLENNSPFPNGFDENEASEDIKEFIKVMNEMHIAVKENNIDNVKKYLKKFPNFKFFYNLQNKSIATFAAEENNMAIYGFLLDHGCSIGRLENHVDIYKCPTEALEQIRHNNITHARIFDDRYIWYHYFNSVAVFDEHKPRRFQELMREAFEIVNENDDGKLILKITAMNNKVQTQFDFNRETINFVNPFTNIKTRGLFSPTLIKLFIGAKKMTNKNTKNEAAGILKHEHCHMALWMIFRNDCNPYGIDDDENRKKFEEIRKICQNIKNKHEFIERVYQSYRTKDFKAELIVRVPQMLTHYKNDEKTLNKQRKILKKLFDYYENFVVQSMEESLPVLQKLSDDRREIKFEELTTPLQSVIFHSSVEFQGILIKFQDLFGDKKLEFAQQLTSEQIQKILNDNKILVIGKTQKIDEEFYIEREFQWLNKIKKFKEILKLFESTKLFLVVDKAGAGKSTTFKHLLKNFKSEYKDNYVSYIDLKFYSTIYEKYNEKMKDLNLITKEILVDFLVDFLNIKDIELALFKFCFETNRVILLFDGVDEISPTYKHFFMNLVQSIKKLTMNYQWISSRRNPGEEIAQVLKLSYFILKPYTDDDIKSMIQNYLKNHKNNLDPEEIFDFLKTLDGARNENDFNNPLIIKIITEYFIKENMPLDQLNLYNLYKYLFEKKIEILGEKEKVIGKSHYNRTAGMNIWKVHQVFAIKLLTHSEDNDLKFLSIMIKWLNDKSNWKPENIYHYGFLYVDNWDKDNERPIFIHRTFAEFFMAEFFIQFYNSLFDLKFISPEEFSLLRLINLKDLEIINNFIESYKRVHSQENIPKLKERFMKVVNSSLELVHNESKTTDIEWIPWLASQGMPTEGNLVYAGYDVDHTAFYAARAYFNGDWLPAKFNPQNNRCYISYGGYEFYVEYIEYLCGEKFSWKKASNGQVPKGAVPVGKTLKGDTLYIGRAPIEGTLTPGKVHPERKSLFLPFNGDEYTISNYEVLVRLE
ncbi:hypothetical protein PVAND_016040 [Polypedilum vanderplanki]|uniref:EF-hand domain-containing protein n=1 Tax=Polypedilum vanderplanki TaxID=319348 RepID=A0A9J6BEA9_POLVA|nr:hypothetical protein PVAND_016040 [Polypedilum vanderplanki]